MAIYINGTLIAQINKVFFNGTQLSSAGKVYGNGTQVWTGGTLTLIEQVFNASGTFTVPSDAVNNEFYVGCTAGGGSGKSYATRKHYYSGGGSGRVSSLLTLTPQENIVVTVGAPYGSSSFGGLLTHNPPTNPSDNFPSPAYGTNGGGNGSVVYSTSTTYSLSTASNCPAMFTLVDGAVNNTNNFFTAKSYGGGAVGGGGGCYGAGASGSSASPNSGGGSNTAMGQAGSGKVVVYYYKYI